MSSISKCVSISYQEYSRIDLLDADVGALSSSKTLMFERFVESSVLAQFERDVQPVKEITLRFCTGKGLRPRTKLRLLSIRLTPLQNQLRSVCLHLREQFTSELFSYTLLFI